MVVLDSSEIEGFNQWRSGPTDHEDGIQEMSTSPGKQDDSYALALDNEAQELIELKQKLTYFLITADALTIAFVVNFLAAHLGHSKQPTATSLETSLVIASSVIGLLGAGACLLSLHLGHMSYTRHLRYRHERKQWSDLTDRQQNSWDRINAWTRHLLTSAFLALFVQVLLAVGFFIAYSSALAS